MQFGHILRNEQNKITGRYGGEYPLAALTNMLTKQTFYFPTGGSLHPCLRKASLTRGNVSYCRLHAHMHSQNSIVALQHRKLSQIQSGIDTSDVARV